jgi:hypothetical protein
MMAWGEGHDYLGGPDQWPACQVPDDLLGGCRKAPEDTPPSRARIFQGAGVRYRWANGPHNSQRRVSCPPPPRTQPSLAGNRTPGASGPSEGPPDPGLVHGDVRILLLALEG